MHPRAAGGRDRVTVDDEMPAKRGFSSPRVEVEKRPRGRPRKEERRSDDLESLKRKLLNVKMNGEDRRTSLG